MSLFLSDLPAPDLTAHTDLNQVQNDAPLYNVDNALTDHNPMSWTSESGVTFITLNMMSSKSPSGMRPQLRTTTEQPLLETLQRDAFQKILKASGEGIICLQEVTSTNWDWLENTYKETHHLHKAQAVNSFSSVLMVPKKWEVETLGAQDFNSLKGYKSFSQFVHVQAIQGLKISHNNETFHVYGGHLPWQVDQSLFRPCVERAIAQATGDQADFVFLADANLKPVNSWSIPDYTIQANKEGSLSLRCGAFCTSTNDLIIAPTEGSFVQTPVDLEKLAPVFSEEMKKTYAALSDEEKRALKLIDKGWAKEGDALEKRVARNLYQFVECSDRAKKFVQAALDWLKTQPDLQIMTIDFLKKLEKDLINQHKKAAEGKKKKALEQDMLAVDQEIFKRQSQSIEGLESRKKDLIDRREKETDSGKKQALWKVVKDVSQEIRKRNSQPDLHAQLEKMSLSDLESRKKDLIDQRENETKNEKKEELERDMIVVRQEICKRIEQLLTTKHPVTYLSALWYTENPVISLSDEARTAQKALSNEQRVKLLILAWMVHPFAFNWHMSTFNFLKNQKDEVAQAFLNQQLDDWGLVSLEAVRKNKEADLVQKLTPRMALEIFTDPLQLIWPVLNATGIPGNEKDALLKGLKHYLDNHSEMAGRHWLVQQLFEGADEDVMSGKLKEKGWIRSLCEGFGVQDSFGFLCVLDKEGGLQRMVDWLQGYNGQEPMDVDKENVQSIPQEKPMDIDRENVQSIPPREGISGNAASPQKLTVSCSKPDMTKPTVVFRAIKAVWDVLPKEKQSAFLGSEMFINSKAENFQSFLKKTSDNSSGWEAKIQALRPILTKLTEGYSVEWIS